MLPLIGRLVLPSAIFLLLSVPLSEARSPNEYALVAPIVKDANTSLYMATLSMRSPLIPLDLTIDLGGRYVWVVCDQHYKSVFYHHVRCGTPMCKFAGYTGCGDCDEGAFRPGCNNNSCTLTSENPIVPMDTAGQVSVDMLALGSTNGTVPGFLAHSPRFIFSCAPQFLTWRIPEQSKGIAALGIHRLALPAQLSRAFGFPRKFAICLPSESGAGSRGVMFFGDGPYVLQPNINVSESLAYTPLLINPVSQAFNAMRGEPSYEYFIQVKGIKVNGKPVPIDATLLSFDKNGNFGTKISSVIQYTRLEQSIYKAVTEAFLKAANYLKRVKSQSPLEVCFSTKNMPSTSVGPSVPTIDLVLKGTKKNEERTWTIIGANSLVFMKKNVACLAIINSGVISPPLRLTPVPSIVIGGHQLHDHLLQFDLENSTLGFSSSLLFQQATCSNFKWSR